jgi:hypothetical protein
LELKKGFMGVWSDIAAKEKMQPRIVHGWKEKGER